ncbi:hypothetical protein [Streptomyces sp. NPDC055243]|uniref:hypothetical protein n=1 Tax=Streptomyces sp. NPDC055243 TaxID=3365720 RepID=UPI0037D329ED
MAVSKVHSTQCVEEAEETVKELRAALARAGIILPSLRIDPTSWSRQAPCPHIELGHAPLPRGAGEGEGPK